MAQSDMKQDGPLEVILSILRHELGNSVNAVKITLDVLRENFDRFDDQKKRAYLERGSVLVGRQTTLVQALKNYSKFNVRESSQFAFIPLWERFLSESREMIAAVGGELIAAPHPGDMEMVGDSLAFLKTLHFILENALEAVSPERILQIELAAVDKGDDIEITVGDNGQGMDSDQLAKATVPLFSTKTDHTGMGLPIACKLVNEMGGAIDITSTSGVGTRVAITVPKNNI